MAATYPVNGMEWVEGLGDGAGDFYRRVLSTDFVELDAKTYRELKSLTPGSGWGGINEYREVVER